MFKHFEKLAPVFRQSIWNAFLEQETSHRLVLLNRYVDGAIEPHKQLVSPLLSVNQESRGCALRFYTTKLDVHAYPKQDVDVLEEIEYEQWPKGLLDSPSSPRVGSLYLNPRKDILVVNHVDLVRDSAIRYDAAAVSAVTHEQCTAPQVYSAPIRDLNIF